MMSNGRPALQPVEGVTPFPVLLTKSAVPQLGKTWGERAQKLAKAHPKLAKAGSEAIDAVGEEFTTIMAADRRREDSALTADVVGRLVEVNHHLLRALGIDDPDVERVRAIARQYGCRSKMIALGELQWGEA